MIFASTPCCAVDVLHELHNGDSVEGILAVVVNQIGVQGEDLDDEYFSDGSTAIICFTTPEEKPLEKTLKKAGFKKLTTIQRRIEVARRKGSGRKRLTMWIVHRRDLK